MATGWYIGVDGKARKVKAAYVGVDGKARKVKAGYVGVDGKARKFYTGRLVLEHSLIHMGQEPIMSFYGHVLKYDGILPKDANIVAQFTTTTDPIPTENTLDIQFYVADAETDIEYPVYAICAVYINGQSGLLTENMWKAGDAVECTLDTINGRIYFTFEEVI